MKNLHKHIGLLWGQTCCFQISHAHTFTIQKELERLLKDLKEEGNTIFREKNYSLAGEKYTYALHVGKFLQENHVNVEREFLSTVFCNRAACCIKMVSARKRLLCSSNDIHTCSVVYKYLWNIVCSKLSFFYFKHIYMENEKKNYHIYSPKMAITQTVSTVIWLKATRLAS